MLAGLVMVLWGLALAILSGLVTFGLLIGMAWALVWGDHPWPDWALPSIGVLAVLSALTGGVVGGRAARAHFLASGRAARLVILIGGGVAVVLVVLWVWAERG